MLKKALTLVLLFGSPLVLGVSFEQDTTLSKREAQAFQKFKTRVTPKLHHDYQKEDLFLLRHLRAKSFDVNKAEDFILKEMQWRKDNNMERIHDEDWSDIPNFSAGMRVDGTDREGRPLIIWELGDFDLRKASLAGKTDRLVRWTFKNWDEGRLKVRELQQQGKNVTRFTMILDLKNINAVTNVNPASFPYYISASLGYDPHFPGLGDRIFLINTPGLFETVLSIVRPGLSQETRDNLKVYGKNQADWLPAVSEAIDLANLPLRYGGTKPDYN